MTHRRNPGERYVNVIGAGYATGRNDGIFGMSLRSERYSFIYVMELGGPGATEPIIKTTCHEVGHQFGTKDDHQGGDDGITAEEQRWQDIATDTRLSQASQLVAIRNLAKYRAGLIPGVTVATQFNDYKVCVGESSFPGSALNSYHFCPYHRQIIQDYRGW